MKTKIYSFILLMGAVSAACSDNWEPNVKGEGVGHLSIGDINVANGENIVSRAGVSTDNFIVSVADADGQQIGSWVYSKMPELIDLPVGAGYKISVKSHNQEPQAWDAPYYEGVSEPFDIRLDDITNIGTISAKFSNIAVTIRYTEDMKAAMGSDCSVKVVANDNGSLDFVPTETRTGYFQALPDSPTMVATFSGTINGSKVELRKIYKDVVAGNHYYITFGFKAPDPSIPEETGDIFVDPNTGISIDMSVDNQDVPGNVNVNEDILGDSDRPGKEDPKDPVGPDQPDDPVEDLFTLNTSMSLTQPMVAEEGKEYAINIVSKNPLTNLKVRIESDYLTNEFLQSVGLMSEFDLANLSPELEETLGNPEGFNFPVGDKVKGQTNIDFVLSPFIPLLNLSPTPDDVHKFHLTIKDDKGNEKTVTLTFISGVQ